MASGQKKKKKTLHRILKISILLMLEIALVNVIVGLIFQMKGNKENVKSTQEIVAEIKAEVEEKVKATPTPAPTPTPTIPPFQAHAVESTKPTLLLSSAEVQIDGESVSTYESEETIQFGKGSEYTAAEGIVTFRGNNFRDNPTYGTAKLTEKAFGENWTQTTGSLTYGESSWTGSGWTGQPLMMKWPKEVKAHMNLYDWAKEKEDLVEVIYACMDGYVYFMDLDTGEHTRDNLYLGYTFKGSGALDPRGYPIMYVGAGYDSNEGTARVFIINLFDCSVMYTFGNNDPFSLRGNLSYFDSSALVDAKNDNLIYPGENGILYKIHLNTMYDKAAGTISINPSNITKWRYYGNRTNTYSYWLGMEDSAVIYRGYLFVADNGGNFFCINLNTMQVVWVQDILDDSNSTPVMSIEDDHPYLYVSTSFHLGWRSDSTADVPIWKIDAETGEIVWQTSYTCYSYDGVSGGVQSTIALGDKELSDYIYVTVSRTPSTSMGVLACINKKTGAVEWEHSSYYAWSSPVCVYGEDGSGVVIYGNSEGEVFMLDGKTGEVKDTMQLSGNIEASPAVYESRLVVGSRDCRIYGVELK